MKLTAEQKEKIKFDLPLEMKELKVKSHVCNGEQGMIFCTTGEIFQVCKKDFYAVMKELRKKRRVQVSKDLTLIYDNQHKQT